MTSMLDALKSAQFVTNAEGQRTAIQLNPVVWEALVIWVEAAEQIPTVEELTQKSIGAPSVGGSQDIALANAAASLSEASFTKVWDNPEDDIYNDL